jgi:DNA-binding Lrp family transcriptional regulator
MSEWLFLSNHGIALWCVARDPGMTLRQIGDCVGVTERTAHGIVDDLVQAGYLKRYRQGNRNGYEVQRDMPMRPRLTDHMVGEIIDVLRDARTEDATREAASVSDEVSKGRRR